MRRSRHPPAHSSPGGIATSLRCPVGTVHELARRGPRCRMRAGIMRPAPRHVDGLSGRVRIDGRIDNSHANGRKFRRSVIACRGCRLPEPPTPVEAGRASECDQTATRCRNGRRPSHHRAAPQGPSPPSLLRSSKRPLGRSSSPRAPASGPTLEQRTPAEAVRIGLAAVVVDGFVRDLERLSTLELPDLRPGSDAAGRAPTGPGEVGVPLRIGEAEVRSGDWIVADADGVVVIPKEDLEDVISRAEAISETEAACFDRVLGGASLLDEPYQDGTILRRQFAAGGRVDGARPVGDRRPPMCLPLKFHGGAGSWMWRRRRARGHDAVESAPGVEDVRLLAKKRLPRLAFDFIEGGAEGEVTLRANRQAFDGSPFGRAT